MKCKIYCFRYLSETEDLSEDFKVLVGGVLWLVRDGVNYVNEALTAECADMQETGNLQYFADVQSARTALGHDAEGRVVMAQVNGKTGVQGCVAAPVISAGCRYLQSTLTCLIVPVHHQTTMTCVIVTCQSSVHLILSVLKQGQRVRVCRLAHQHGCRERH